MQGTFSMGSYENIWGYWKQLFLKGAHWVYTKDSQRDELKLLGMFMEESKQMLQIHFF